MAFVDTDALIEEREGMRVAALFESRGEDAFRRLEAALVRELCRQKGLVVAMGGGAVLDRENLRLMKESGRVVLLDVPPEVIEARLEGDQTRPLLNLPDKKDTLRALHAQRLPLYRDAADSVFVNADDRPAEKVAREIAEFYGRSRTL